MVNLVQQPVIRPHRCAMLPNIAASNERVGFFDFGTDLDLEHVYVSFTAFAQMAERVGWVPRGSVDAEVARLRVALDEADRRRDEAEQKLASAEKQLEAVEVLRRGGFTAGKTPGRKPKQQPEKAVA